MRTLLTAVSALTLATACAHAEQTLEGVAADTYQLEKNHAFLTAKVKHMGLSQYFIDFTDFDATLEFDPEDPTASRLSVTIDPTGLDTQYPDPEKKQEWESELANEARWFNSGEYPEITFVSTGAEMTGEFTGKVTGDLTFLGVTKPVTLDVTYHGTANTPWFGDRDLLGFTATTTLTRSAFGMNAMVPNISDEVEVEFSGEFLQAADE